MLRQLSTAWMNNPQMQEYAARNPNGMLARALGAYSRMPSAGGLNYSPRPSAPNMQGNNAPTSFATGGMVTPTGGAVRPGAGMIPGDEPMMGADAPAPMDSATLDREAQNFARQHPDAMQKIQGVLTVAMQNGDLTPDELNMAIQLAKAALANPASYPQIRQFAIQNGLGTEADIPQQLDKGLLFTLIVAGKAMQSAGANPGAQTSSGDAMQGQKPAGLLPEYSDGGMTGDRKHLAVVHPREYVIPEDALIFHGKKTFDRMVEQAREPKDGSQS